MRRLGWSRLSWKIAVGTAGSAAVLLLLLRLFYAWPLWFGGLLVLTVAGAAYGTAHRLLVSRLGLAHSTLKQIRKHQFENLEAAHLPRGDELNDLIWQVYRTGHA